MSGALTDEILGRLSALERRVRRRELDAIARAAAARGGLAPKTLITMADEHLRAADAERARLDELRSRHARAGSERDRARVIEQALAESGAPARARRAARRGWLDLDAMSERSERAAHDAELRGALCFRLAGACATDASTVAALVAALHRRSSSGVQRAVCETLVELSARVPHAISDADEIAAALAQLGDRPRRLQAAWAELALTIAPAPALAAIRARLEHPPAREDDFVVRQLLVKLLGRRTEDRETFFVLARALRDPSEHVRMAVTGALATTGGADALELLRRTSQPPPEGDASARVRASALIAIAGLARARRADGTAALAQRLADPDPLVARVAGEELAALADGAHLEPDGLAALARAASEAALGAVTTSGAEPALSALESLALVAMPALAAARAALAEVVDRLAPGASARFASTLGPVDLGRVLASLARDRPGVYASPVDGGYRVWRGAQLVRRGWRIWHELRTRTPYKRQDGLHTVGRRFPGVLRAHAAGLAEATATVPGEPLYLSRDGGWGAHLPTVDDLLSTPLARRQPVTLFSRRGITRVVPPPTVAARLRARVQLSRRYVELADLRLRALASDDPSQRTRYLDAVEQLGFQLGIEPWPAAGAVTIPLVPTVAAPFSPPQAAAASTAALALAALPDGIGDALHTLTAPGENTLGQLGLAALGVFGVLVARNLLQAEQLRRDRGAIPLVIGGWGTRGKSGTERLKAALFHGLDVEALVKTTGCEAMFIHGVPGRRPTEIFIHRSYDKATIWEQRDLVSLAARLGVPVFLYECMALAPPLVSVVQQDWMRDDLSTLTNAYPDHEDLQGPAGHDVARAIAGFIRSGGVAITTEQQMLPLFLDEARRKQARLVVVAAREHELLAGDLLARLPYQEHPRNVALVRRLAVELGVDPDLATADMADHVVADLGVLKAYPEATHRGRRLTFVNGMSANERTGFISNWERSGCQRALDGAGEGRWVVTVVNNRYDRVARSKAFADILVRDAAAERHVLIGTNLSGLLGYVSQSLDRFLDEVALFRDGDDEAQLPAAVDARLTAMRHRLRLVPAAADSLLAELAAFTQADTSPLRAQTEAALGLARDRAVGHTGLEELVSALSAHPVAAAVARFVDDGLGAVRSAFFVRGVARRALFDSLERAALDALADRAARPSVCQRQRELYRALFLDLVHAVGDAGASGDQVVDAVARACPPGARVTVLGAQNIKGTGLDFVYRFVHYEEVVALVARLDGAGLETARAVAAELSNRSDWSVLDAPVAARALHAAAARLGDPDLAGVASALDERAAIAVAALESGGARRRSLAVRVVEKTFDTLDAVRRRWHAGRVLDALVHREISHERAALEMRRLDDREKKGWLRGEAR